MNKINKLFKMLALVPAGLLLFAGCSEKQKTSVENDGNKQEESVSAPVKKQREARIKSNAQVPDKEEIAMIPNPFLDSTADGIRKQLGFDFNLPEDVENVRYSIISGKTAQIDFDWQGADCTARIEASGETQLVDISGYYYTWQNQAEVEVGYNKAQARWTTAEDGRVIGICIWWDVVPGIMYSVSMDSNADKASLAELANSVYVQMQGETP